MGRYVNGRWNESLPDLTGNGGDQSNSDPVATAPAPMSSSSGGGGSSAPAAPSAPAPTGFTVGGTTYDTNNQADRATLRTAGYFIDDSGVYAPGAGDRVANTWSGSNESRNVAPSPTRLPILNGNPVSPSNGFTGAQTPNIMFRGDPLYSQYFGPDTPGYSSTSKTYNATPGPLPDNQQTFEGAYGAINKAPLPAPAVRTGATPSVTTNPPAPAPAGFQPPAPEASADALKNQWMNGLMAPNEQGGFGPYSLGEPPRLTVESTYNDKGRMIEKSVDQNGNPYFRDTGPALVGVDNTAPPATPSAPAQPAPPTTTTPTQPAATSPATPANKNLVAIPLADGSGVAQVPAEQAQAIQAYFGKIADQAAQARAFAQGLEQDKFDLSKMIAVANQAYQQGLIKFQNDQLAQQSAYQAMQIELAKQSQELQRQQQAQQVSMQQQQLDVQRQSMRGRRRVPQVRYR